MNERKTKIVARIADNNCEVEYLTKLFNAGVDVMWLNTAHQTEETSMQVINNIRQVSDKISILIDTKGPEVRTKNVETPLEVKKGDIITFTGDLEFSGENVVHVDYPNFHNEIPVGELITYDDTSISTIVVEKFDRGIKCEIQNPGTFKNKKSINVPNVYLKLPSLTPKDVGYIHFAAKNNVDFVIHSFVRNVQDLNDIKAIFAEHPEYKGKILSKIENREGFDNIESILENSDGIMVARGDLMAEVPMEELPYMQKKMVAAAVRKSKYCIVATQVLKSMVTNSSPTRAEVCDIGNAVLDGTTAISMSDETAYGSYPVEATTVLNRVTRYTEKMRDELHHFAVLPESTDDAHTFAKEVVATAKTAGAKAIVTAFTNVAWNKALGSFHPVCPVVAGTSSLEDFRDMMMGFALRPVHVGELNLKAVAQASGLDASDTVVVCENLNGTATHKTVKVSDIA